MHTHMHMHMHVEIRARARPRFHTRTHTHTHSHTLSHACTQGLPSTEARADRPHSPEEQDFLKLAAATQQWELGTPAKTMAQLPSSPMRDYATGKPILYYYFDPKVARDLTEDQVTTASTRGVGPSHMMF